MKTVCRSGMMAVPLLSLLFAPGLGAAAVSASEYASLPVPVAAAAPALGGCPLFPADSIWNVRVDALPVHIRSGDWVANIGRSTGFHMDFGSGTWDGGPIGIPFNLVAGSQIPAYTPTFYYPDESDPGPYPIPASPLREWGSDHHVLIVDTETCKLYEIYDASLAGGQWYGGSGAIWDLNSHALRPAGWTSADAAGLPILPGLVRYDEVAAGQINHAIRFTASVTQRAYVWPARHFASSNISPAVPPLGARFRLKATFDIAGFDPQLRVILRAMKSYGIILADNGSNWYVSGAPDERWDNDMLHKLDVLTGDDFEAVDASGLMIDPNSGQARTSATLTVASINPMSGVTISVSPNDSSGQGGELTPFNRTYESGTQVTLTAPATSETNTFRAWSGCTRTSGTTCFVTMNGSTTVRVNYRDPAISAIARNDFDGDGRSDIGCYYPFGGNWYGMNTGNGFWQTQFGYAGTLPISGDFDGDGKSDIGCYHPTSGNWYVMKSTEGFSTTQFGYAGTIPIVGDFDGDGKDDIGCYYALGGNWYVMKSKEGFATTQFGYAGTIPIVGDFDGDGKDDIGCYYAPGGNWYMMKSTEGFATTQFGYAGTIPIVGDFDGDGRDDIGCYDPTGGNWYVMQSTAGFWQTQFGYAGTEPVVGDFDGDGKSDLGCYYPAGGNWYVMKSTEGFWVTQFGYEGTIPLGGTLR